ncbi:type IX secretion system membrane protein PorP/SprF [Flavobacteriales bacterium AH-315-E23]|nr:type IX secretion system membrane protein PorP/SprF [Flavobacteriales bacterium AH-315-E23]
MNMFKNINLHIGAIILLLTCSFITESSAQQTTLYSQYMFNPFTINPAYAGSRSAFSTVMLYRNQWLGMNGAPKSQSLSLHTPLEGKNVGLGFNVINDKIGPTNNLGIFGTYAYHLTIGPGKLSMALRAGTYRFQLDGTTIEYKNTDKFDGASIAGSFIPSFDFGLYYYTKTLYGGLAILHLAGSEVNFDDVSDLSTQLARHYMVNFGYAYIINRDFVLKPSMLMKYTANAPVNIDINMSVLMKQVFWLGVSYRTSKDLVIIAEFNITDILRAGYSYDLGLNSLQDFNNGSHELFIGADFSIGKPAQKISTRLL